MPKPGHLTSAIAAAKAELLWKEEERLTCIEGTDAKGTRCVFWSDEPIVPAYRAVDCTEGRAFLLQLAKTAGNSPEQAVKWFEKWTNQAGDLGTA